MTTQWDMMHLSHPLASLMSPVEAAAIEVLARADTDFTGRQVARLAGASNPNGIRKAMLRLSQSGIVLLTPEPHATRYRANREHLLWPAIELALGARDELERRIALFASHASPGSTVAVYGSVARGDSNPDSDVDLLVIHTDDTLSEERDRFALELADRVERWTGNVAQVYDLSDGRFHEQLSAGDPITQRWLAEARTIAGRDISERGAA
jgi:predicted nucleotidyltransferase